MSVIERIMKAYASKHELNPEQATLVRVELSRFIDELTSGQRRGADVSSGYEDGAEPAIRRERHGTSGP